MQTLLQNNSNISAKGILRFLQKSNLDAGLTLRQIQKFISAFKAGEIKKCETQNTSING